MRLRLERGDERGRPAREIALGAERERGDATDPDGSPRRSRARSARRRARSRGRDGRSGRLPPPMASADSATAASAVPSTTSPRRRPRFTPKSYVPPDNACVRRTQALSAHAPTGRRRCPRAPGGHRRARRSWRGRRAPRAAAGAGSRPTPRPVAPPRPPPRRPPRRATRGAACVRARWARSISGSSRWSSTRSGSSDVKRLTPTITRSPLSTSRCQAKADSSICSCTQPASIAATAPPSSSIRSMSSVACASSSSVSASTNQEPPSGSAVAVVPASCMRICCVRSASVAARSVGSASASSKPFVCTDWAPP